MKADVTYIGAKPQRDTEGLNGTVQVLIVQSVLVVPNFGTWVCDLICHKPDAVGSRVRLDLIHRGARPCLDGRLHSQCVTDWREREISSAAHAILAVRSIVIHVALRRMRLAPGVFTRGDVLRFSKVGRALIKVLV